MRRNRFPLLSSFLLVLTYSVGGWLFGSWARNFVTDERAEALLIRSDILDILVYILGLVIVAVISMIFTAPVTIMTINVGTRLKPEIKAILSVLIGAMTAVLIIGFFEFFVRLLVLLAAASLLRLDLQLANYKEKQSLIIIAVFSTVSFLLGILIYRLLPRVATWAI